LSYSDDLIAHAISLLPDPTEVHLSDVRIRRAVSAAYYAVFHRICADAAELLAPHVSDDVRNRIQRWFEHAEMKKICGRFTKPSLDQPLLDLIGSSAPNDLLFVASSFITLQESRHLADYDLGYTFEWYEARITVELAIRTLGAWERVADSAEANIFVLSLLLWKLWEKER
jgi:hypothetical protein